MSLDSGEQSRGFGDQIARDAKEKGNKDYQHKPPQKPNRFKPLVGEKQFTDQGFRITISMYCSDIALFGPLFGGKVAKSHC